MVTSDLISRLAASTRDLPNSVAWQRIEELLAEAKIPRRDWPKTRAVIWVQRRKQQRDVAAAR